MTEIQSEKPVHDDLTELYHHPEALHPDLTAHFRDGPVGKMIHHPLLINVMTIPGHHKADNLVYCHRKNQVAQSWRDKDWSSYIALHERPYRAEALQRILSKTDLPVDPQVTWKLIKAVWTDSENVDEHDRFWKSLWKIATTELTLDIDERKAFDELPDPVPVWHGLERKDREHLGVSWTTDKGIAEWFAQRFARSNKRPAFIASGFVSKEHVRAYLLGRGEREVITFPEKVLKIVVEECKSSGHYPSRLVK
jgi:hypothetical protein